MKAAPAAKSERQTDAFPAAPRVVVELQAVVEKMSVAAGARQRAVFYELLAKYAEAARESGAEADFTAVRAHIVNAQRRFSGDLMHADGRVRSQAAALFVAFADERPVAQLARERYFSDFDPTVRRAFLNGLVRFREPGEDWLRFLEAGLSRELNPANRFLLRYAEICEIGSVAPESSVEDLVSSFVGCGDRGEQALQRFGIALSALTAERQLAALVNALRSAGDKDLCRFLSERLLCLVFEDERSGWQNVSYSRIHHDGSAPQADLKKLIVTVLMFRIFPFLRERLLLRRPTIPGLPVMNYWGLKGTIPRIPAKLTAAQRRALEALVEHPEVWKFRTNLWELFGLPDNRAGVRTFLTWH